MVAEGSRLQQETNGKGNNLNTSCLPGICNPIIYTTECTFVAIHSLLNRHPFKNGVFYEARISLAGLLEGNPNTVNELVSACKTNGFFYLDFSDVSTAETLKKVDELVDVGNSVFKLSLEEKEEYSTEKHLPSRLQGYVSPPSPPQHPTPTCRLWLTDVDC